MEGTHFFERTESASPDSLLAIEEWFCPSTRMPLIRIFSLCLLVVAPCFAQEYAEPKYDIPSAIAKLPERSDFYGNWLRADGVYRLKVEPVADDAEGVVAKYFNPNPINVESAAFDAEANEPSLTVVLRDEGYPGSTYRLVYIAEAQVLAGTYARPGSEPSEVYFIKQEAE
jgi:hypothetical protein